MFKEEYGSMVNAAVGKVALLEKKPGAYVVSSILAGAFIGVGVLIMSTVGSYAAGTPYVKLAMGMVFSCALSLVVMAGAELFTGNNMVGLAGVLGKKVSAGQLIKLWIVCLIGNWLGSILISVIFVGTGLADGDVGTFMVAATQTKAGIAPLQLVCRGVLCNFLVCLAVWCGFRCKNEVAKLIMIFWCITAFVTVGFEHCVANMTMMTVGMLKCGGSIAISGYFYNILVSMVGNIIGGTICVSLPYYIISKE